MESKNGDTAMLTPSKQAKKTVSACRALQLSDPNLVVLKKLVFKNLLKI